MTKIRTLQIYRGTTAQNDAYTGSAGELTMDTTNKTLRVHDGETLGGTVLAKQSEIQDIANADYVVERQDPTAENGYTWYRKYKSGWVEQGGIIPVNTSSITLPIVMSNSNYSFQVSGYKRSDTATMSWNYISSNTQTTTGFTIASSGGRRCWEVKGIAAS